jgi:hypothetical protein
MFSPLQTPYPATPLPTPAGFVFVAQAHFWIAILFNCRLNATKTIET